MPNGEGEGEMKRGGEGDQLEGTVGVDAGHFGGRCAVQDGAGNLAETFGVQPSRAEGFAERLTGLATETRARRGADEVG
jgi:hypothetical protein